jgi:DNA mismatch repair protein MutS
MQVDKVTLHDLSVFHSEEYQSVFHHVNLTLTNGGREHLRYLLAHPLDSIKAIEQTQLTIQQLSSIMDQYPISPSNGTVLVMEKFYESPINNYPSDIGSGKCFALQIIEFGRLFFVQIYCRTCAGFCARNGKNSRADFA